MNSKTKQGYLFTFEGIEGSGKSTQIQLLYDYLAEKEYDVIMTKQPGGTIFGQKLRQILLHRDIELDPLTVLFLYEADRSYHIQNVIQPALNSGKIVLCDRFCESSVAYQSYGDGLPKGTVFVLNLFAKQFTELDPHIIFYVDVSVEEGLRRKYQQGGDEITYFENQDIEYHNRVRNGYQEYLKTLDNVVYIDGTKSIDGIQVWLQNFVEDKVNKR